MKLSRSGRSIHRPAKYAEANKNHTQPKVILDKQIALPTNNSEDSKVDNAIDNARHRVSLSSDIKDSPRPAEPVSSSTSHSLYPPKLVKTEQNEQPQEPVVLVSVPNDMRSERMVSSPIYLKGPTVIGRQTSDDRTPIGQHYKYNRTPIVRQSSQDRPPIGQQSSQDRPPIGQQSSQDRPPIGQQYSQDRPPIGQQSSQDRPPIGQQSSQDRPPIGQQSRQDQTHIGQQSSQPLTPMIGQQSGQDRTPIGHYSSQGRTPIGHQQQSLDRRRESDHHHIENSMEGQNLIIQENQRLSLEEQLALIHAGHQIHHDVVVGSEDVLEDVSTSKVQENLVLSSSSNINNVPKVVMLGNEDIEITIENEEEEDEEMENAFEVQNILQNDHEVIEHEVLVEPDDEDDPDVVVVGLFPPWYQRLSGMLTGFLELGLMVDVQLRGQDGGSVPAHQLILTHVSPLLHTILRDVKKDCPEETLMVVIPGTKTQHIRALVYSVYTGTLPESLDNIRAVWSLAQQLGFQIAPLVSSKVGLQDNENQQVQHPPKEPQPPHALHHHEDHRPMPGAQHSINGAGGPQFSQAFNHKAASLQGKSEPLRQNAQELSTKPAAGHVGQSGSQTASLRQSGNVVQSVSQAAQVISRIGLKPETILPDHNPSLQGEEAMDQNIQVVQTELGEILILTCHSDSISVSEPGDPLVGPGDPLVEPRHVKEELQGNRDMEELNHKTPQTSKTEKGAEATTTIKYEPADKPCPLCFKPRIEHKNREIDEQNKGNHKGNLYKCCHCAASRLTAKKFFIHLENHVAKKHVCDICKKGYSYKHLLEEHVWKMHEGGQYEWILCPYDCEYKARYKQTLSTHINEHHKGIFRKPSQANKKVVCPNCNKVLKQWYFNQHHSKTCSQPNKEFKCDICEKEGFINNTTLQNHKRIKHSDDRPFPCEYCPCKYATAMALSSHRARKHGMNARGEKVPKKMYSCHICTKLLTTSIKLKQHVEVIHEGRRDFACKFCGKRFTSKSNLQIHEGSQHTGILPYNCDKCDKSFSRKLQLRTHMLQVHDTAVDITNIDSIRTRPVEGGIEGEKVMEGMGAMGGMDLERDDHFYVVNDLDAVHDVQVGDVIIPMELMVEGETAVVEHSSSTSVS